MPPVGFEPTISAGERQGGGGGGCGGGGCGGGGGGDSGGGGGGSDGDYGGDEIEINLSVIRIQKNLVNSKNLRAK